MRILMRNVSFSCTALKGALRLVLCLVWVVVMLVTLGLRDRTHSSVTRPSPQREVVSHPTRTRNYTQSTRRGIFQHEPCRIASKASNLTFYSEAGEDRAVLIHYFLEPLVCHGTFVEVGALDGITFSNTKLFEDSLNWTGVLVEWQPENVKVLMLNRPHTKNYGVAVCPEGQRRAVFTRAHARRGINPRVKSSRISVPCNTIANILANANVESVDFFSLDAPGEQLLALQTMDWSIPVRIFLIAMGKERRVDAKRSKKEQRIVDYMLERGFREPEWDLKAFCSKLNNPDRCQSSVVFENQNIE